MAGMVGGMAGGGASPGSASGPPSWEDLPDYPEPGRIQALPAGTEAQLVSHNRPGNQYEPYVRETVRGMSTGTGMSYEKLSNDYTSASYSSARSASLE
jgi:capsid protein